MRQKQTETEGVRASKLTNRQTVRARQTGKEEMRHSSRKAHRQSQRNRETETKAQS